jgi:hypothetical protein
LKKILLIFSVFAFTFLIFGTVNVCAQESESNDFFYTNVNGVKFTKAQYDNLSRVFSENTIATFTQNMVDVLADDTTLFGSKGKTQYFKTDTYTDAFGNIIAQYDTEVSKEEAENRTDRQLVLAGYPTHQTTYKRITINIIASWSSSRTITVELTWITMPSTRSHDVIAIKPNRSYTINLTNISGYLEHNGSIVQSYTGNSSNVRNISGNGGVGLSMPLPTGGTSMSSGLTLVVITDNDPFDAYGSYQHAQQSVTLSQSKAYNLTANGLTNIINFTNSTTAGKYDNMSAVNCSINYANLTPCS